MKQFLYLIILLFVGTGAFAQNKPVKPIVSQRPKVKPTKSAPATDAVTVPATDGAKPAPETAVPINTPVVSTPA